MSKTKKRIFHVAITVVLIILGAVAMVKLTANKPQIKKRKPSVSAPMVRTVKIKTVSQTVCIRGEGTVKPLRQINLVPQVGGKVVYVSPALVNGGEFHKNDALLLIDPADYKLAVTLAGAKMKNSESLLMLAREEAAAAREEWLVYHGKGVRTDREPPPLVAKEPQLKAAQARLEADRADLRKALLNLERTELFAPFDGRVSQENVDAGQYVLPGQALAILYSTDVAEIVLPLEEGGLFWFHVPGFTPGNGPGSSATVQARIAGRNMIWTGRVVRAEGKLDERTRMINVVIRVEKPYAKKPPLAAGLYVTVEIAGINLPHAIIIPRSALRQGNVVWVVNKDNKLQFHKVGVARLQDNFVIVRSGLKDGDMVIMSSLKAVTNGMTVRAVPVKEEDRE